MKKISLSWLLGIQCLLAFQWLNSAYGKLVHQEFMNGISQTLTSFAAKTDYSWYGKFLSAWAIPHSVGFGNLIRFSELAVGIALALGVIIIVRTKTVQPVIAWVSSIAFFGAAFMNLNFFLASAWTGPASSGINLLMLILALIFGVFYITQAKTNKD